MIKKKSLSYCISLSSLLTALNAVIIFLSTMSGIFLIADAFLVLFLPFLTTFAFLFLERKTSLCYVIASLVICLLISIEKTCFYLLPSLVSGLIFGLFIKKKTNIVWIIAVATIVNAVIMWGVFITFDLFFNISLLENILNAINEDNPYLIPLFLVLTSLVQIILNTLIIVPELKKYEVYIKINDSPNKPILITSIVFALLGGTTMYFNQQIAHFCVGIAIICSIPTYYYLFILKKYVWMGLIIGIFIFGFAILSTLVPGYGLSPLNYLILVISSIGLYYYQKKHIF